MSALDLLNRLKRLGVGVSAEADRLKIRAPEGALTPQIRDEIAARKPELLRLLTAQRGPDAEPSPIPKSREDSSGRLSPGQERLWGLIRRDPETPAYNLAAAFSLRGTLDVGPLKRAFDEIVHRHESLRSTIHLEAKQPTVRIGPPEDGWLVYTDLRTDANPTSRAHNLAVRDARTPFDLEAGPLARFHLIQMSESDYVLVIVIHHLVSDGWSFDVLYDELTALYEHFSAGHSSPLTPVSRHYADFVAWQHRLLDGTGGESHRAYWTTQLKGPLRAIELLPDLGTSSRGYLGDRVTEAFSLEVREGVERLSAACNASPFTVLLAAYAGMLREPSGQFDTLVCSPVAGRERPELRGVVGYLNNLLVLRVPTGGDPPFNELVTSVQRLALEAYQHQDLPFQEVAGLPDLARIPLTRAMFAFQADPPHCLKLGGVEVRPIPIHNGTANFDIGLTIAKTPDGLDATLTFRDGVLGPVAGIALLKQFRALLGAALKDFELPLSKLDPLAVSRPASAPLRRILPVRFVLLVPRIHETDERLAILQPALPGRLRQLCQRMVCVPSDRAFPGPHEGRGSPRLARPGPYARC